MEIYYAPLVLASAAVAAQVSRSRDLDRSILMIAAIAVAFIAGLRWYADVDYAGYVEMYQDTPPLERFNADSTRGLYGEPGYLLLNSVFKWLGLDFFVLALVAAIVSMSLKTFVAYKLSRHASLAITLYLCIHFITIEFIQMRWAVATGFIALAFYYLYRRRASAVILSLALATLFHYFSLVYWVAALMASAKGYHRFQVLLGASAVAAAFLSLESVAPLLLNDSEVYLLFRLNRFAGEELSTVGVLSYAKVAMYPALYFLCVSQRRSYDWAGDPLNLFLYRASMVLLSITLAASFMPILHHRATVVADFIAILWVLNAAHIALCSGLRTVVWAVLVVLFSTWHVIDVANYLRADRLYQYRTWTTAMR
jgi:hypothetical protein